MLHKTLFSLVHWLHDKQKPRMEVAPLVTNYGFMSQQSSLTKNIRYNNLVKVFIVKPEWLGMLNQSFLIWSCYKEELCQSKTSSLWHVPYSCPSCMKTILHDNKKKIWRNLAYQKAQKTACFLWTQGQQGSNLNTSKERVEKPRSPAIDWPTSKCWHKKMADSSKPKRRIRIRRGQVCSTCG